MSQANTEDTTRRDGSLSSEGLGPLPEPMKDYPEPGERTYTEDALLAFGAQERAAERERCAKLCEDRAIHQNGRHVVTLEMNQMAQAIRGKHDFRA